MMSAWSPEGALTRTRKRRSTVIANKPNYTEPASSSPSSDQTYENEAYHPVPVATRKRKGPSISKDVEEGAKRWHGPSKFTEDDVAAARLLMNLNAVDAATGTSMFCGAQNSRRADTE